MSRPFYHFENFEARNSLGYLNKRLFTLISQAVEEIFADQELSFVQWVALVSVRDDVADTCAGIARHLGHDSGATTRMIDQLERRGLLTRNRCKTDRRVVRLGLTAQGRAVAKAMTPRVMTFWNAVLKDFSHAETTQLIALLTRLLASMEREVAEQKNGEQEETA